MNPWRRTRNELAGAWRSVQYDLGRRSDAEDAYPVADVTSTGMCTFGGDLAIGSIGSGAPINATQRPPRRMVAVGAFGVLAVAGAAGSYFAVVNGLGSLFAEEPAGAEPYPLAAAAPPPAEAASTAGLGRGTARPAGPPPPPAILVLPTTAASTGTTAAPAHAPARNNVAQPRRTATPAAPATPECDCVTPPIPTPTAPAPTPTPSPSTSPSDSAEPGDTEQGGPAESAAPSESGDGFVHSWRGRGY